MVALGALEAADAGALPRPDLRVTALFALRGLAGLSMLAAALGWLVAVARAGAGAQTATLEAGAPAGAGPRVNPSRGVTVFAIGIGLCDAATGAALIAAPLWTLARMGIDPLPAEPVFLRWIGAFVLAIGLAYLYPFLLRGAGRRRARLATVFEVTAIARGLVALTAGGAIAAGALPLAWLGVPLFDAAVAIAQVVLLARGALRDG